MIITSRSIFAGIAVGLATQVASAQFVTNVVSVRNTQGIGVAINYATGVTSTSYDKPNIRCDQTTAANKAWIGWDLSSVWATYGQANLADASFTLWGENGTGRNFSVAALNNSSGLDGWSQSTINWNNAPGNSATTAYPGSTALNQAFDWAQCYGGAAIWSAIGGGVDLARPDLGTSFDQSARYASTPTVNSSLAAWLMADTDGLATLMVSGSNNQNIWVGTNGFYANDFSLGRTSTNSVNGTFGDVIRDSPTLKLTFVTAVPEPATVSVFTLGLGLLALARRRVF